MTTTSLIGNNETAASLIDLIKNATTIETLSTNSTNPNDSEVLRDTFAVYGSAMVVAFLTFCWARLRYPDAYNIRQTDCYSVGNDADENTARTDRRSKNEVSTTTDDDGPKDMQCLAKSQHGFFSWTWKLFQIDDKQFVEQNGLDAMCLVRICNMGFRLTLTGIFVSIWLMPVYSTARGGTLDDTMVEDKILEITTGHIPNDSPRFIATTVATYVVFGHAMYLILKEMQWFTNLRHSFLQQQKARNFAVYIRNIPEEWRSNRGIKDFFEKSLRGIHVQEASICLGTRNLRRKVAERDTIIDKLERAVAEQEVNGERPQHVEDTILPGVNLLINNNDKVDSIDFYTKQLKTMNADIAACIDALHERANVEPVEDKFDSDVADEASWVRGSAITEQEQDSLLERFKDQTKCVQEAVIGPPVQEATELVTKAATEAVKLVFPNEDGEIFSAAFVVFGSLSTTHASLQMVHHEEPYTFEVLEAPDSEDVFWANAGREHHDLQLGRLMSFGLSSVICLFWTVPVSFVASLSSVKGLRQEVEAVDNLLNAVPALEPLFELLAPQLLVALNSLLPMLLTSVTNFEGNISGSVNQASLFVKLAAFMIIQTFFVSAISGGVLDALQSVVSTPKSIIDLLATTLPAQSTFFVQLCFVSTVSVFVMEGFGIVRIGMAVARRHIGSHLTPRERRRIVMGLSPMSEVKDFEYGRQMSSLVFLYMVYLVYVVIAPLVSFVCAFCFLLLEVLFRHQMIYIYKRTPDSGGRLWMNFIKILTTCFLIAELTVFGLLALKDSVLSTIIFPLVVVSVIFSIYLRENHFNVAEHLPTRLCLDQDSKNIDMDFGFAREAYLQPEMRERNALPELSREKLQELGLVENDSPKASFKTAVFPNGMICRVKKLAIPDGVYTDDCPTIFDAERCSLTSDQHDA
ncbi:CSC1-like protein ERD4 [Seminavis robusta]|uniref:CSC1-like protein ERD4 n=1 Tax=Seminavis robusta TaxID=568900 RepID=A0A9N8EFF4_9STRA|nr:CSC1-like protein ERD4 [Seminavis robusta]|eukprot:Sro1000_g229720.1 CSC1-like protein ERD4 (918) ;mRNA; f:28524-31840